jgi:hypothetical protein
MRGVALAGDAHNAMAAAVAIAWKNRFIIQTLFDGDQKSPVMTWERHGNLTSALGGLNKRHASKDPEPLLLSPAMPDAGGEGEGGWNRAAAG